MVENKKRNKNDNLLRIGKDRPQPTPEAKSAGWDRRRHAQQMLNDILSKQDMTMAELDAMAKDIEKNPHKHKAKDVLIFNYVYRSVKDPENKLGIDWFNRNVPYAPQKTEITGEDGKALKVDFNSTDDLPDDNEFKQFLKQKNERKTS